MMGISVFYGSFGAYLKMKQNLIIGKKRIWHLPCDAHRWSLGWIFHSAPHTNDTLFSFKPDEDIPLAEIFKYRSCKLIPEAMCGV